MTLVLFGGTVVSSLEPPMIERGDVTVEGSRVSATGTAADGGTRLDCSGCLIVPGNVCAHTHLYSALARGMPYGLAPPANFEQILQRIWWRLDRALDEESIRASALVGGLEALLCGTTTVVDHHASPKAVDGSLDIVAGALEDLGVRSALCYETSDRDGAHVAEAGVRENERFLAQRRPLTRGMVGAHASFTLSPETLDACVDVSQRTGAGLHIHVAEDASDQRDSVERFGIRVVPRLEKAGVLHEGAMLAHCIHLDEAETASVRESGASIAHNPTSNMNNSVGHAAVAALGDRVALGTDGIGADMFAEAKAAYFRGRDDDVSLPIGWPTARLAEGARFIGRLFGETKFGRIEPGAPADLVVLDTPVPTPMSAENLAGHWMFGIASRAVRDVVVAGELVVRERRLVNVDQDELAAVATEVARRLWERCSSIGPHGFDPKGGDAP
jgi:putative selenium metabolism protein SsnA